MVRTLQAQEKVHPLHGRRRSCSNASRSASRPFPRNGSTTNGRFDAKLRESGRSCRHARTGTSSAGTGTFDKGESDGGSGYEHVRSTNKHSQLHELAKPVCPSNPNLNIIRTQPKFQQKQLATRPNSNVTRFKHAQQRNPTKSGIQHPTPDHSVERSLTLNEPEHAKRENANNSEFRQFR